MSRHQERALKTAPILLYVGFVLILMLGALAFHTQAITSGDSIHARGKIDSEDFEEESETASRSMIG